MERGTLRVYLGAAPGVGKTFAMLGEGRRRRDRGADVVVGIVETHGRSMTATQLGDLEVLPRRNVEYRGASLSELDVGTVRARRPDLVLIDEYAHTNAPGSANDKRWQDVEEILDAGIDVITTVNIQHLESLNDVVAQITGVVQAETVPDRVLRAADQIELVDMTPEALRRRMAHGNIYPPERADAALANFFRPGNLGAMRELALLWVADRVEEHLGDYLNRHRLQGTWETRERIVVGLAGGPGTETVIRRASRIASRVSGELIGVHVASADGRNDTDQATLTSQFALLASLGGTRRETVGDDPVASLADIARTLHATQIVIGETRRTRFERLLRGSFAARLGRMASGIDIHIVADSSPTAARIARADLNASDPTRSGSSRSTPRRPWPSVPRRIWWAVSVLGIGLPLLTAALHLLGGAVELSTDLLLYLLLVVGISVVGGRVVAIVAAVASALAANWFFVEPRHTLTIDDPDDLIALGVFVAVGLVVATLVDRAARQASSARRVRAEASILARAAAIVAADPDPVAGVLDAVRESFDLTGATLVHFRDGNAEVLAGVGTVRDPQYSIGARTSPTGESRALIVAGRALNADDQRVLASLADQLSVAIDRQDAKGEIRRAEELAAVDGARAALLRSVSHDLRTPLATIKALASGLLDDTVQWPPSHVAEMHVTIDQEADRLNRLIGNLLDASRLETGTLAVNLAHFNLADAVDVALVNSARSSTPIHLDIPQSIPLIVADPSLLDRVIANLVENAQRHSPADTPVTISAAHLADEVHLCIIDRGPGIPRDRRRDVLIPFQRLNDTNPNGVGLGLAIVDGFVRAMNGRVHLDDTPGGGLSTTVVLPAAPMSTDAQEPIDSE